MSENFTDTNAPTDYDFANKDTLTGLLRHVLRENSKNHEDMLPGIVVAYDRVSNMATIQPQIKILTKDNKIVSRVQHTSIPVFAYGGGGFVISFPVKAGDKGWIKANDRDISLYMQAQAESGPNTNRLHSFRDGMFFPDAMASFTVASVDIGNMVIQNLAGTVKIAISNLGIAFTTPNANGLTHNGVPIGASHAHTNVQTGSDVSGPPVA
jgi:hypothetical protein